MEAKNKAKKGKKLKKEKEKKKRETKIVFNPTYIENGNGGINEDDQKENAQ